MKKVFFIMGIVLLGVHSISTMQSEPLSAADRKRAQADIILWQETLADIPTRAYLSKGCRQELIERL